MQDPALYSVAAGAMLGPLWLAFPTTRLTTISTAPVMRYASSSPRTLIESDRNGGALTAANIAAGTGLASNWVGLGAGLSRTLEGYSAVVVVADAGASAIVETVQAVPDPIITSGLGLRVSLSTQPIGTWSTGHALALPYAVLDVMEASPSGADARDMIATKWLDGSISYAKGGRGYGTITLSIPEVEGAGKTALDVAGFSSADYSLLIERLGSDGVTVDSTAVPVSVTTYRPETTGAPLRIITAECQITRPRLRITY